MNHRARVTLLTIVAGLPFLAGCFVPYYLFNPGEFFKQNANINGALPVASEDQLKSVDLPAALAGSNLQTGLGTMCSENSIYSPLEQAARFFFFLDIHRHPYRENPDC